MVTETAKTGTEKPANEESGGWRFGTFFKNSGSGIVNGVGALFKGETWEAVGDGIADAGAWVGDKAGDGWNATGRGLRWASRHPDVIAKEVGGFFYNTVTNPVRSYGLYTQGFTNAVASTVGMVGDLGVGIYNNTARNVWNMGYIHEADKVGKIEHQYSEDLKNLCQIRNILPDGSRQWVESNIINPICPEAIQPWVKRNTFMFSAIDPKDPNAKYERVALYGAQGVVEAAAIVGLAAVSGGTAAAGWTAVRGSAYGARVYGVASRAAQISQAFQTGARAGYGWAMPFKNFGAPVEGAAAKTAYQFSRVGVSAEIGGNFTGALLHISKDAKLARFETNPQTEQQADEVASQREGWGEYMERDTQQPVRTRINAFAVMQEASRNERLHNYYASRTAPTISFSLDRSAVSPYAKTGEQELTVRFSDTSRPAPASGQPLEVAAGSPEIKSLTAPDGQDLSRN